MEGEIQNDSNISISSRDEDDNKQERSPFEGSPSKTPNLAESNRVSEPSVSSSGLSSSPNTEDSAPESSTDEMNRLPLHTNLTSSNSAPGLDTDSRPPRAALDPLADQLQKALSRVHGGAVNPSHHGGGGDASSRSKIVVAGDEDSVVRKKQQNMDPLGMKQTEAQDPRASRSPQGVDESPGLEATQNLVLPVERTDSSENNPQLLMESDKFMETNQHDHLDTGTSEGGVPIQRSRNDTAERSHKTEKIASLAQGTPQQSVGQPGEISKSGVTVKQSVPTPNESDVLQDTLQPLPTKPRSTKKKKPGSLQGLKNLPDSEALASSERPRRDAVSLQDVKLAPRKPTLQKSKSSRSLPHNEKGKSSSKTKEETPASATEKKAAPKRRVVKRAKSSERPPSPTHTIKSSASSSSAAKDNTNYLRTPTRSNRTVTFDNKLVTRSAETLPSVKVAMVPPPPMLGGPPQQSLRVVGPRNQGGGAQASRAKSTPRPSGPVPPNNIQHRSMIRNQVPPHNNGPDGWNPSTMPRAPTRSQPQQFVAQQHPTHTGPPQSSRSGPLMAMLPPPQAGLVGMAQIPPGVPRTRSSGQGAKRNIQAPIRPAQNQQSYAQQQLPPQQLQQHPHTDAQLYPNNVRTKPSTRQVTSSQLQAQEQHLRPTNAPRTTAKDAVSRVTAAKAAAAQTAVAKAAVAKAAAAKASAATATQKAPAKVSTSKVSSSKPQPAPTKPASAKKTTVAKASSAQAAAAKATAAKAAAVKAVATHAGTSKAPSSQTAATKSAAAKAAAAKAKANTAATAQTAAVKTAAAKAAAKAAASRSAGDRVAMRGAPPKMADPNAKAMKAAAAKAAAAKAARRPTALASNASIRPEPSEYVATKTEAAKAAAAKANLAQVKSTKASAAKAAAARAVARGSGSDPNNLRASAGKTAVAAAAKAAMQRSGPPTIGTTKLGGVQMAPSTTPVKKKAVQSNDPLSHKSSHSSRSQRRTAGAGPAPTTTSKGQVQRQPQQKPLPQTQTIKGGALSSAKSSVSEEFSVSEVVGSLVTNDQPRGGQGADGASEGVQQTSGVQQGQKKGSSIAKMMEVSVVKNGVVKVYTVQGDMKKTRTKDGTMRYFVHTVEGPKVMLDADSAERELRRRKARLWIARSREAVAEEAAEMARQQKLQREQQQLQAQSQQQQLPIVLPYPNPQPTNAISGVPQVPNPVSHNSNPLQQQQQDLPNKGQPNAQLLPNQQVQL